MLKTDFSSTCVAAETGGLKSIRGGEAHLEGPVCECSLAVLPHNRNSTRSMFSGWEDCKNVFKISLRKPRYFVSAWVQKRAQPVHASSDKSRQHALTAWMKLVTGKKGPETLQYTKKNEIFPKHQDIAP